MNNLSILKYEIKRLIFTKKYFYLVSILALETFDVLMRLVIDGYYGSAPFSKWSYTEFISLILPLLMIILILLCTTVFNKNEISVRKIIYSSPISQVKYYIIKYCAILVAFIVVLLVPIIMSFIYYDFIFEYTQYANFNKPMVVFLIPTTVFILGLSLVLGKKSVKFLYVLIPLIFFGGSFNLTFIPVWIDLFGNNFLCRYGWVVRHMSESERIQYSIPSNFIHSRIMLVILGILLFIFACNKKVKNI